VRSHLIDGKLVEPSSPAAAQNRQQQLAHEVGKIERAVVGVDPRPEFASPEEYRIWRKRTMGCLGWLRSEKIQLERWMKDHHVEVIPTARELESFWQE
jgi:hypothetical protein